LSEIKESKKQGKGSNSVFMAVNLLSPIIIMENVKAESSMLVSTHLEKKKSFF